MRELVKQDTGHSCVCIQFQIEETQLEKLRNFINASIVNEVSDVSNSASQVASKIKTSRYRWRRRGRNAVAHMQTIMNHPKVWLQKHSVPKLGRSMTERPAEKADQIEDMEMMFINSYEENLRTHNKTATMWCSEHKCFADSDKARYQTSSEKDGMKKPKQKSWNIVEDVETSTIVIQFDRSQLSRSHRVAMDQKKKDLSLEQHQHNVLWKTMWVRDTDKKKRTMIFQASPILDHVWKTYISQSNSDRVIVFHLPKMSAEYVEHGTHKSGLLDFVETINSESKESLQHDCVDIFQYFELINVKKLKPGTVLVLGKLLQKSVNSEKLKQVLQALSTMNNLFSPGTSLSNISTISGESLQGEKCQFPLLIAIPRIGENELFPFHLLRMDQGQSGAFIYLTRQIVEPSIPKNVSVAMRRRLARELMIWFVRHLTNARNYLHVHCGKMSQFSESMMGETMEESFQTSVSYTSSRQSSGVFSDSVEYCTLNATLTLFELKRSLFKNYKKKFMIKPRYPMMLALLIRSESISSNFPHPRKVGYLCSKEYLSRKHIGVANNKTD